MKKTIQKLNNNLINGMEQIELRITYRFVIYLMLLGVVGSLVSNAIFYYYENKIFALAVWIGYAMTYLVTLFILARKRSEV